MTLGKISRTGRSNLVARVVSLWQGSQGRLLRAVVTALLLVGVFTALRYNQQPGLAVSMYGLVPVLLGVTWFGLVGGLLTATGATAAFVLDALLSGGALLTGSDLLFATLNRAVVFYGLALLVTHSLRRQRILTRPFGGLSRSRRSNRDLIFSSQLPSHPPMVSSPATSIS